MDVVQLVKEGKGKFEWYEITSEYNDLKLKIKVFRDAMKFNNIPAMTWDMKPVSDKTYNGVRLPATAYQLQQIADFVDGMLMTPKVIDMIWLQAGIKFDAVINVNGIIVANSDIHKVHQKIESKFNDDGVSLISCVGKYWCLINHLNNTTQLRFGNNTACNYGWFAKYASGPGITPGTKCWQRPGFRHDNRHFDPSQTIRVMHRKATLIRPDGSSEVIDLHDVAKCKKLAPLITHEERLEYLRQKNVPKPSPITNQPQKPRESQDSVPDNKTETKPKPPKKDYPSGDRPPRPQKVEKKINFIDAFIKLVSRFLD